VKLRLRHLRLRATTTGGVFGSDFAFPDGLVVLRGKNTSGKSTTMKAFLYALGLEGMLSPSKVPPFPECMTKRLQGSDAEFDVLESFVAAEIENDQGQRVVCTRAVVGAKQSQDIVQVTEGGSLSQPDGTFTTRGYFVRLAGAATRESGFHQFLSDFVGWQLPSVPRFDGEPGLLYLECLFPFLFVEQLTGWRGIYSRMPTFLGIPEVWNRAVEYLLKLDRGDLPLRRFLVERSREKLQARWRSALEQARIDVRGLGTVIRDLPPEPAATWPPPNAPFLAVVSGPDWEPIGVAQTLAARRVQELDEQELPQVQDIASQLASAVRETEARVSELEDQQTGLLGELRAEEEYLRSLEQRLTALEEDRRKNEDELTIRKRGSVGDRDLLSSDCPVCGRARSDSLLAQDVDITPMPIEANLAHIKAEIGLFRELRDEQDEVVEGKRQRLSATLQAVSDSAALLREQRRTLRADGQVPSSAAIRERMQAEETVTRLASAEKRFNEILQTFAGLSDEWRDLEGKRRQLKTDAESPDDLAKRNTIERAFKAQLVEYGFSSFGQQSVDAISIDPTTLRPTKDGFDLGEMSASDTIRCVWAYLLALLECSRTFSTHHPGILLFDEPRQQSASPVSFAALIRRASMAAQSSQQVIFATSEESPDLIGAMVETGAHVIELQGKILQPIS
jgi:hypothetical protein